jgi:hypothetical protein
MQVHFNVFNQESLFSFTHHEVHRCSDVRIGKRSIATFGWHGAFAFDGGIMQGGSAA